IFSDQLANQDLPKSQYKEFARFCDATTAIFKAMLDGNLADTLKTLPPHYSYLPNEFKVKRIKRLSR
ncbi:unnamed protein product, partial [Candidula unifasciata]